MKKTLFALIAGSALSLFAAESVPGRVTADRLNLRFAPELKSPVAGKVEKDAALQVFSVKGNWLEVSAPESLKVYLSEAYIANGKTIASIKMHSDKSSVSPCLGVLPKGSEVKLIDDRGYGWVRIAPPATIRLYTAKMYVEFDEAKLLAPEEVKKAEATPEAAPAAKAPEVKAAPAPATPVPEAKAPEAKAAPAPAAPALPQTKVSADVKADAAPVAIPAPKEDVK